MSDLTQAIERMAQKYMPGPIPGSNTNEELNAARYRSGYIAAATLFAPLLDGVKFYRHDEDCGVNAAHGSYAFARGCSCGLDDHMDAIQQLLAKLPKP